ncbi:hypothetical protein P3L10_003140 [Capsicum annuum]
MHIEKNICDSLLGTLLEIDEKSKDHVNSRYDLQEMGIREELQPIKDSNGNVSVLKNVKLPKGCASNISDRVNMKEMKISGYKSHDAHFIMHHVLQVTVRKALPKNVALTLIRLCNFFRAICINKIKLGGPIHLYWMYSIERALCNLKGLVRNRSCLEVSIAEGYLVGECLIFCSRYLHDGVKMQFSRYQTEDEESILNLSPIFPKNGHPIGSEKKKNYTFFMDVKLRYEAHRYVLFNTGDEEVKKLIEEHKTSLSSHTRSNAWVRATNHSCEFSSWFKQKVKNVEVSHHLKWLSKGPNMVAKRYRAYFINGYQFHTKDWDAPHKTQNSRVTLSATTDSFASARDQNSIDGVVIYYRVIRDIIEIDYYDEYGLTRVYFNKLCSQDDLFVLASQVYQVSYVADPIEKDVYYARNKVPIDLYYLEEENCPNIGETFWREPNDDIDSSTRLDEGDFRWARKDGAIIIVDIPSTEENSEDIVVETSEDEDEFDVTVWDWMEADD